MKKFFLILLLLPVISLEQIRDTDYYRHGDTIVQRITIKTETEKPFFIVSDGVELNLYQAIAACQNDSFRLHELPLFIPKVWPIGFFQGVLYPRTTIYRAIPQKSGLPKISATETIIAGAKIVPNYFFILSLVSGILVLILIHFAVVHDYKECSKQKEKMSQVRNFLLKSAAVVFVIMGIILACLISYLLLGIPKYVPWYEMVLSFVLQIFLSALVFRRLSKKYSTEH